MLATNHPGIRDATGQLVLARQGIHPNHAADEDEGKHNDTDDTDDDFKAHGRSLIAPANARIDGTQSPTKTPASLSTKNHSTTEKTNEINAASKNNERGGLIAFTASCSPDDEIFDFPSVHSHPSVPMPDATQRSDDQTSFTMCSIIIALEPLLMIGTHVLTKRWSVQNNA